MRLIFLGGDGDAEFYVSFLLLHPVSSLFTFPLPSSSIYTLILFGNRKVKCVTLPPDIPDNEDQKCKGCYNLDEPCTYEYVVKRAGRKTT